MKPKRISKPKNPKILQQQSSKIKEKLQSLKQQIQQKKKQKQMSKTQTRFVKNNNKMQKQGMGSTTYFQEKEDSQLVEILGEMKIENMGNKLKEKGIVNCHQFLKLKEEEIDNWKDIAVGYRIKIKRCIEKYSFDFEAQNSIKGEVQNQQKSRQAIIEKQIEAIIQQRKEERTFIPLRRQYEEEEVQQNFEELDEEQQEFMIQSLMKAFKNNKVIKTILVKAKDKQKKQLKKVNWSKEVDILESKNKNNKRYPKQIVSKDIFKLSTQQVERQSPRKVIMEYKQFPEYHYCWKCLKFLNLSQFSIKFQNKYFCQQNCKQKYRESLISQHQQFFDEIEDTELKFNDHIHKKLSQKQIQDSEDDDLEEIDLSII